MFVRCPIAQIVNVQFDDSVLLRPFHDAFAQRSAADFRKQRDNVDSHLSENIERSTSNVQRRDYGALDSFAPVHSVFGLPVYVARRPPATFFETLRSLTQTPHMSFHNLEHRALAVTRCRTGQQGANSMNGLTRPANHTAHISASNLQFEGDHSAVADFREHHVIRKFDQLANHELEKFSHPSKD